MFKKAKTHGNGTWTAKVYNTLDVWTRRVDCAMQWKSQFVDTETNSASTDIQDITAHVNLHQTGRCHLVMQHAKRCYEEMLKVLANTALKNKPSLFITDTN